MIPALVLMGLVALGIMLVVWLPAYRLQRAIDKPFPVHFSAILSRNIPAYSRMPPDLQEQLQRLVKQFLYQKKFIGCDDFLITDEVRVSIAGKACMLLLNRPPQVYPDLHQVLVYPSAFLVPRNQLGLGGVVTHASQTLAGESWSNGQVILAWDHVMQSGMPFNNGQNVVLHEFAHQLDSESGSNNGAPLLRTTAAYRRWSTVLSHEFAVLQEAVLYQIPSVLDYYGATSPAEFFAVATETFFEKSALLAEFHPALFGELKRYYRVDPRDWLPAIATTEQGLPH
jgi:Mlc titration factor MtfA (ptsG expression regulator)